ncbi:P-loop containing nucleoside triphosphate hydrolase protein [Catenaria anguillulae PL171]|uniref:Kinesin-like protein n=1 Tax=Catenaria anguillulae PL171 TaxID=765915 RepID=A0A1Y2HYV4_9FUNG|nr:P-loop containing nucleoside triphosphate hydrolase protein [Catenaria anguillulae PL171]
MQPSNGNDESRTSSPTGSDPGISAAPLNQAIKIFARIRPRKANPNIRDKANEAGGLINHTKEHFGFRFDRVFDDRATQEEVFDHVAKDIIQSVLDGFNATIFAYGQTGSGKTFTITGGAERYSDRGLIPRTVQFIFKQIAQRPKYQYQIAISYLEIYNENGYDLLDDSRDAKRLEDLPKVILRESDEQQVYLQNLSCHPATNEEEALNWLFTGDTNKMIAETPSNPASSRSHCLFIISVTSREEGSDVIRKSKLHLVDLAGSERVAKTGIDGTLLKEAKSINLSLHFLEHVIVALHEKALGKRTHIPYRNSMMTSILRDSLGGNCKTCMIATIATEDHLLEESISTCRFAQRVALISNRVSVNEELDPYMIIARLKQQIQQLKAELALARGESSSDEPLPDYELARLQDMLRAYLAGDDSAVLFTDYRKVVAGFNFLRQWLKGRNEASSAGPGTDGGAMAMSVAGGADPREVAQLKQLIAQRDTEISVLIPMVNQYKAKVRALEDGRQVSSNNALAKSPIRKGQSDSVFSSSSSLASAPSVSTPNLASMPPSLTNSQVALFQQQPSEDSLPSRSSASITEAEKDALLESFKASYPPMESIEQQKAVLKERYARAKELGQSAHLLREEIKRSKDKLSCLRANFDPSTLPPSSASSCLDLIEAEEAKLREFVSQRTAQYKVQFQELKELKMEIEHLQHLLDKAKMQFNRDFTLWLQSHTSAPAAPPSASPVPARSHTPLAPIPTSFVASSPNGSVPIRHQATPTASRSAAWGTPSPNGTPAPRAKLVASPAPSAAGTSADSA